MNGLHRGTIRGFRGSWGSGIALLELDDRAVPCENAPTVRALDAAFGEVVGPGHTVHVDHLRGREIVYRLDDLGLLAGFVPAEEWASGRA